MLNWKLINRTYLYDGTFEGLLTIVFDSYTTKTLPQKIISQKNYLPNFLDHLVSIQTDPTKSQRIWDGILKTIGKETLFNAYYAFLSNEKNKEIFILKYLCDGFSIGPKINTMLTVSYVFKVIHLQKRTLAECHKLKGLLRFQEVEENLCYASIHPDHFILEPLGQHFVRRLPSMKFIIHDKNRNLCFLYDGKQYRIVSIQDMKIPSISSEEKNYQALWKMFFQTIAIKERNNAKCQMQFMPKKYWKDLIEEP